MRLWRIFAIATWPAPLPCCGCQMAKSVVIVTRLVNMIVVYYFATSVKKSQRSRMQLMTGLSFSNNLRWVKQSEVKQSNSTESGVSRGWSPTVGFNLHFQNRQEYVEVCEDVPRSTNRHCVKEICGVLHQICHQIKKRSGFVSLEQTPSISRLLKWVEFTGVCLSLGWDHQISRKWLRHWGVRTQDGH